jgi:hypothetical protein
MSSQSANTVATRLQQARESAGYGSADQVAEAFGWPDYAADENGERTLTSVRARLYAHAFHVDPEWLVSGDRKPAPGPEGEPSRDCRRLQLLRDWSHDEEGIDEIRT